MELKTLFIIFEGFFEWQKKDIAIETFNTGLCYMQINNKLYYMNQGIIDIVSCVE